MRHEACEGRGCSSCRVTSADRQLIPDRQAPNLDKGACVGEDPELFFDGHPKSIEEAKGVCRRCPVIDACLAYALSAGHVGVWAATDDDERRNIKRRAARAARAAS